MASNYERNLSTYEQVLTAILISFIWACSNALRVDHLGWLNNLSLIYQLVSTLIIITVLLTVT